MRDIKLMIKHTFKESYKSMLILNGVLLGSMFLISLFILIVNEAFLLTPFGSFFIVMGAILIVVLIYAAIIGIIYTVYKTMNQKLFTNEGYLTFTLPVSVDSIIISKIVVNLIWIFVLIITTILGFLLIIGSATLKNMEDIITIGTMLKQFLETLKLNSEIEFVEIIALFFNLLLYLIISILSLLFFFNVLAFVNTGTLKKGKSVLAIIMYIFGIELFTMILMLIAQFAAVGIAYDYNLSKYVFAFGNLTNGAYLINFTALIVYGGSMVGLYMLAKFILKKKIELL